MINAFAVALALAAGSIGQGPHCAQGPYVLPPGPGNGHGFPNNNPDGYGWYDTGDRLPLGADRTSEYFFRRYYCMPIEQMFLPNYYNPYVTRGQRYVSYSGCGGDHPAGGPPLASAATPEHPYTDTIGTGPRVAVPPFTGRVEAPPVVSGGTGLTP
jgi:hypothetical protein